MSAFQYFAACAPLAARNFADCGSDGAGEFAEENQKKSEK